MNASAVREIHLRDCELSGSCLTTIIEFSTGLEKLTYRFGGREGDGSTGVAEIPQFVRALRAHRLTLRSLDIDIDSIIRGDPSQDLERRREQLKESYDEKDSECEDGSKGDSDGKSLDSSDSKSEIRKLDEATKS